MCFFCFCEQFGLPMVLLPINIVLYIAAIMLSPFLDLARWVYWKLHPEEAKEARRERRRYFKAIREAIMEGKPEETDADREHDQRCREQGIVVLKDVIAEMDRKREAEEAAEIAEE